MGRNPLGVTRIGEVVQMQLNIHVIVRHRTGEVDWDILNVETDTYPLTTFVETFKLCAALRKLIDEDSIQTI